MCNNLLEAVGGRRSASAPSAFLVPPQLPPSLVPPPLPPFFASFFASSLASEGMQSALLRGFLAVEAAFVLKAQPPMYGPEATTKHPGMQCPIDLALYKTLNIGPILTSVREEQNASHAACGAEVIPTSAQVFPAPA